MFASGATEISTKNLTISIIIKRSYPTLLVRVINCEIRVAIYTPLRLIGSESFRKEALKRGLLV